MTKVKRLAIPPAVPRSYEPLVIDQQGWWLLLSDLHMPYHDPQSIEAAINEGQRQRVRGVILAGDLLDYHELSTYDKDPTKPRYIEERLTGMAFLDYLRDRFPKAEIIFKQGNHEERLERYIIKRAPALFGLDLVSVPKMLDLDKYRITHVGDKRIIRLGKLNVLHGHEYTERAISSPVNPARGLFLKTKGLAICGHHHQTSEHHEPTIAGKPQGCWSIGCLCQLNPPYRPLNRWNTGFAMVRLDADGSFHVRNMRVVDGKIL